MYMYFYDDCEGKTQDMSGFLRGSGITTRGGSMTLAEPSDEQSNEVNERPVAAPSEDKIREVTIREVNRGFIVQVGCHTFAISTKTELTTKLTEYILNPIKTESKWFKNELF